MHCSWPKRDPCVDAYIAKAAPFAQPILKHLRKIVHAGCPQVEETMKWSMPHFDYKGMMCSMAAHKQHCSFSFRREAELALPTTRRGSNGMGQFGRIAALADLPDYVTADRVRPARRSAQGFRRKELGAAESEEGTGRARGAGLLHRRLRNNKKAQQTFERFSYSQRKEYIEWVTGAKRDATREDRLATAIEWLAERKSRNWKYERKSG